MNFEVLRRRVQKGGATEQLLVVCLILVKSFFQHLKNLIIFFFNDGFSM